VAVAAGPGSVIIKNFAFGPATITVTAGGSVTWTNGDTASHSATGSGFDTGVFGKGKSRSVKFAKAGTFSYICSVHPNMHGTVRVVAASSGGGSSGEGSSGASSSGGSSSGGSETSGSGTSGATAGTAGGSSTGSSGPGASPTGGALPKTGADSGGLAALGALMLAMGAFVRRRVEKRGRA
jgi:LPXTG-motif cell wall-anchored protein